MSYQNHSDVDEGYNTKNPPQKITQPKPLLDASHVWHTQHCYKGECKDGHIVDVYIDTYRTFTQKGEGPIHIARRIAQVSHIQVDWFFDLVLQNEQYFTYSKNYELTSNKLRTDDPISISYITVEGSDCPDESEQKYHKDLSEDTVGSVYNSISIPNSRPLIYGVNAQFSAYISFKLIAGYTNPDSPLEAYVSLGIKAQSSGTISRNSAPSHQGDIDFVAEASASGEVWDYKVGTKIVIIKDLDGGLDADEFSVTTSYFAEKVTDDVLEPGSNSLQRSSGSKIELAGTYDPKTDYTTIIVSFNFEDKIVQSINLGHPLFKLEVEVGGSLEGTMNFKIPGNLKTNYPAIDQPNYLIPVDKDKM